MNRVSATVTSVVNPATEQVIAEVPRTFLEEVDRAIEGANRAFESWRQVAPADRGRLLRRFAEAVDADREELAQLEMRNSGHTMGNARWEAGNNSHSSVRYWTPFGGFKQSGLGRELGPDAPDAFSELKNVFISTEE
jgi:acyl-CoA reductase-like NAD-dependent aldehyde dehydrogenase